MAENIKLYGPPGSGKTRVLLAIFLRAAEIVGPESVGAITFTRAGAEELRLRIGAALHMGADPAGLRRRLPWVGTIHSLSFKLVGLARKHIAKIDDFAADHDLAAPRARDVLPYELEEPYLKDLGPRVTQAELMLWALSGARHRRWPLRDMIALLPPEQVGRAGGPEHIEYLATQYTDWKHERERYDYEDLLELGLARELPVKALLVDEVQDNSPLLWEVADAWGQPAHVRAYYVAGDPLQAIYTFAGAAPELFTKRPGEQRTIGDSYRFGDDVAGYARALILQTYDDPEIAALLASWKGIGGSPSDGSVLHLARTHGVLAAQRDALLWDGEPFWELRGRAPLQTTAGAAYRTLWGLRSDKLVTTQAVAQLAGQLEPAALGRGIKAKVTALAKEAPERELNAYAVSQLLGVGNLESLIEYLRWGDYFAKVDRQHGARGLFLKPKRMLGTIISAKGREADHVVLSRSWATIPGRKALEGGEGAREEACCAYVAVTRRRHTLEFFDDGDGIPYPFPDGQ